MRIAEVIGTVTLSQCHPSLKGGAWRLCIPLHRKALSDPSTAKDEAFVTYDEFNAGLGARIGVCEGAEASAPFHPRRKPIDAYSAAILDVIEVKS